MAAEAAAAAILADDGGEESLRFDGLPGHTFASSQEDFSSNTSNDSDQDSELPDTSDDVDERLSNPTLYVRKYWKKVSPQPPIYLCSRNPATRSYSCKLTLHFPPESYRSYITPPNAVYLSKREAKRAASELALSVGVLEQAGSSMAALDRVGTSAAPRFHQDTLPKRDARYNEATEISYAERETMNSAENPISALNLAVQKYCIENPTQALIYDYDTLEPNYANYPLYRCRLTIRITPDVITSYGPLEPAVSSKLAKEAVTGEALKEGIVTLLKLHNSTTTKVCKQMGLPIPSRIEEHDPVDEENTAGVLAQLIQDVTRNPKAMECEYTKAMSAGGELYGAKLIISVSTDNVHKYEISPGFRTKREAKEGACRVAVKSGIRETLDAHRRLFKASRAALSGFSGSGSQASGSSGPGSQSWPSAMSESDPHQIPNPIGYLNSCIQTYTGRSEALVYEFHNIGPSLAPGRTFGQRFSCILIATLTPHLVRRYTVKYDFPTKKAAKTAVAIAAIEQGLIELAKQAKDGQHGQATGGLIKFTDLVAQAKADSRDPPRLIRAIPRGFPDVHGDEDLPRLEAVADPLPATSYSTYSNKRPVPIIDITATELDRQIISPPPYSADRTSAPVNRAEEQRTPHAASDSSNVPGTISESYLPSWTSQEDVSEGLADQPLLRFLNYRADSILGSRKIKHLVFDIRKDTQSGRFGGAVILVGNDDIRHTFQVPFVSPTSKMAFEAAATKALESGVVRMMEEVAKVDASQETGMSAADPVQVAAQSKSSDPHAQAVSYLQQVCQQLLGVEAEDRPKYELLKKGQGSEYGAILTIPTDPAMVFKVDTTYLGKAAAKDAVARVALEAGVTKKLQAYFIKHLAPASEMARKLEETPEPARQAQGKPKREQADWVANLAAYCQSTNRPEPNYTVTTTSRGNENQQATTHISAQIAGDTFELDAQKLSARGEVGSKTRLARMVLKHLQSRDASSSTKIVLDKQE